MKVLVTGGAGYIGSHTCVQLLQAGHTVLVVDDFSNSSPVSLQRIEQITGKTPKLYEFNLCNQAKLDQLFKEHAPQAVIHFAGFKSVPESVSKPLDYYSNNLIGSLNLLAAMQKYSCNKLVFSSSATVYGHNSEPPCQENSPTAPTNPYGFTKLMMEQMLADCAKAYPKFSLLALRYFNPVGAHESGLIGEDPNGVPGNLFPYITQVLAGKLPYLNVYGTDFDTADGTGVRDFIHVSDVAQGHLNALDYTSKHPGYQIFNLGRGQGYSVLQVVAAFEQATGLKVPYQVKPRRAGDIASSWACTNKAQNMLGFTPQKDLLTMCKDAWRWQQQNPQGYKDIL